MYTLVLIHGAWHGAWCWDKLIPLLESQEINLVIPSLAYQNNSNSNSLKSIGLNNHIEQIIKLLEDNKYTNMVLLGHSYAGMILPEVASHFKNKIKGIVCLDAFVPQKGQSLYNIVNNDNLSYQEICKEQIDNMSYLPSPPAINFGVTNKEDLMWMERNLKPQPLKTFCDITNYSLHELTEIPKLFILCDLNLLRSFAEQKPAIVKNQNWTFSKIDETHNVMITNPTLLSKIIKDFILNKI